ncbi:MAG: type II toxin-antitoxin system RelE/ParE family toxin [Roseivivax sp.]|nr:type II toxin-antitoxin system RelE/ParE family toxin [Roseivivax sp.]
MSIWNLTGNETGFLPSAAQDILWFRYYYRSVFTEGDANACANLKAVQVLLSANPYVGQPFEGRPGVRKFPIRKTPFMLIYRVTSEQIEILRLWDSRQASDR